MNLAQSKRQNISVTSFDKKLQNRHHNHGVGMQKKTDPNSLYRQVFNRDLNFFLYVIDKTEPPYVIKLHVTN